MNKVDFKMHFFGYGWSQRLADGEHPSRPTKQIQTIVSGPEPGYIATSKIVVSCAIVLLKEQNRMPVKGGVLTPAVAFANTSLIERLRTHGIRFETVVRHDQPMTRASL